MSNDLEALKNALATAEVREFALKASQELADALAIIGTMNLTRRAGGGKWPRGAGSVKAEPGRGDSWQAVLSTPFMGMEWGGHVTNVYGRRIGSSRAGQIGLEPMWAPWHKSYQEGYILGEAWIEMGRGDASKAEADAVLAAYTEAFDKAGLKRG